jgi:hypothetical protein
MSDFISGSSLSVSEIPLLLTNWTIGSNSEITKAPALMKGTLPDGDMASAFARGSTWKSKLHIFRKAWTARQFALSGSKICSTSYGWNSLTSLGHGS